MTWKDNRKSVPGRTCWLGTLIVVAGVTLLPPVAGHRRRAASPASSLVASRESMLEYYVVEQSYPRTTVGNIVSDYGLDHRYPLSVINQLRFGFLTHSKSAGRQGNEYLITFLIHSFVFVHFYLNDSHKVDEKNETIRAILTWNCICSARTTVTLALPDMYPSLPHHRRGDLTYAATRHP